MCRKPSYDADETDVARTESVSKSDHVIMIKNSGFGRKDIPDTAANQNHCNNPYTVVMGEYTYTYKN
jgi:hypothetical protein